MKVRLLVLLLCLPTGLSFAARPHFNRGAPLYKQKKFQEAIPHLEKSIASGENVSWAYVFLSLSYLKIDERRKALNTARAGYRKFPGKKPNLDVLIWSLASNGRLEYSKKRYGKAEALFRRADRLRPDNAGILNYLGLAMNRGGKPEKVHGAVAIFKRALRIRPDRGYILGNLRFAFLKSLQEYARSRDYDRAKVLIHEIYRHYLGNLALYSKNKVELYQVDSYIMIPFRRCGKHPDRRLHDIPACSAMLGAVLKSHPHNYQLRQVYGNSLQNLGRKMKGYQLRVEAYKSYLKTGRKFPELILESPLRGRVLPAAYKIPKPSGHSGLWRHAIDYTVRGPGGKNGSYEAPVYAPADGVILRISDGSPSLSNLVLKMNNGLNIGMVHFKPGAFVVRKGQRVRAGQKLGVLGYPKSPHLHMHIFNKYGCSIPYMFKRFTNDEGKVIRNAIPRPGKVYTYR